MTEKNFKYKMIYQSLLRPAHHVSFSYKHGYDWLNSHKQVDFKRNFHGQLCCIVGDVCGLVCLHIINHIEDNDCIKILFSCKDLVQ